MLKKRQLILIKKETVSGVAETPTAADNAVLAHDIEYPQIGTKVLERGAVQSYLGNKKKFIVGESVTLGFKTELKGSGTAGVEPEIGTLLEICKFTPDVTADTSVEYLPNSDEYSETATLYFYQDNLLHKAVGCVGTVQFNLKAGEFGTAQFSIQGVYDGIVDSVLPTATISQIVPPAFVNAAFTFDSIQKIIDEFNIEMGNQIVSRPDANSAKGILGFNIVDRAPVCNFAPEAVALSTHDIQALFFSSSQTTLSTVLGSATGNKCTITAPSVQIVDYGYGDREGTLVNELKVELQPSSGNDEISLLFE